MDLRTDGLEAILKEIGMQLVFDQFQADFSGLNGKKPLDDDSLFISSVFHSAFVSVDEEGTVAAAATVVKSRTLGRLSKEPRVPVFRADHPFLFVIRDRKTGAILFFGRVTNPTYKS